MINGPIIPPNSFSRESLRPDSVPDSNISLHLLKAFCRSGLKITFLSSYPPQVSHQPSHFFAGGSSFESRSCGPWPMFSIIPWSSRLSWKKSQPIKWIEWHTIQRVSMPRQTIASRPGWFSLNWNKCSSARFRSFYSNWPWCSDSYLGVYTRNYNLSTTFFNLFKEIPRSPFPTPPVSPVIWLHFDYIQRNKDLTGHR